MFHDPIARHRLFFALRPPQRLAHAIGAFAAERAPAGARPVLPEHLHITLAIFEDAVTFPDRLADTLAGIGASTDVPPFEIRLDKLAGGYRSTALRPRLRIPALLDFQQRLARAVRGAGLALRTGWDFDPHLTLFYAEGRPSNERIPPFRWTADELLLIDSRIGRTQHDLLGRWPLVENARQGCLF